MDVEVKVEAIVKFSMRQNQDIEDIVKLTMTWIPEIKEYKIISHKVLWDEDWSDNRKKLVEIEREYTKVWENNPNAGVEEVDKLDKLYAEYQQILGEME